MQEEALLYKKISKGQNKFSILITKRPGTGITADNWYKIIGKRQKRELDTDHILKWSGYLLMSKFENFNVKINKVLKGSVFLNNNKKMSIKMNI